MIAMAVMFPERLPVDVESDAERRLFDEFRRTFSDDFTVFAQVAWLSKQRGRGAFDGEADFVVAHPRHGILVLEVKGGGIEHDAPNDSWYSTDRHGKRHQIKDPFQQARNSMHVLRRKLAEAEPTASYRYPMAHAAAFPDTHFELSPGIDTANETVLDLPKVRELKQSVIDAYRYFRRQEDDPGTEAISALRDLLGRSWKVEAILGAEMDKQETVVRELTEQQYRLLDYLGNRPRALISGSAGTGKTLLAVEKAKRLAQAGFRVLFTCFNINLALWVERQLANTDVVTKHFHGICYDVAERAGRPIERQAGEDDGAYYDRFADALLEALPHTDERFDAIVVDEGQDFREEWWVALTSLLEDPEDGVLYIFYDDNQRIYERATSFPITTEPFPLTENCRNTCEIHDVVMLFYRSGAKPECGGPTGEPPKLITPDPGQTEQQAVAVHIDWLVRDQLVRPEDIAILTPRSKKRSAWRDSPSTAWELTWELGDAAGRVVCSSVHAFKGLERRVVIVTELDEIDPAERSELLYVAFSRARQYLVVSGLDLAAVAAMEKEVRE